MKAYVAGMILIVLCLPLVKSVANITCAASGLLILSLRGTIIVLLCSVLQIQLAVCCLHANTVLALLFDFGDKYFRISRCCVKT